MPSPIEKPTAPRARQAVGQHDVRWRRLIVVCVLLVPLTYSALALSVRPTIFIDTVESLLVLESMKRKGPFNHLVEPDPAGIAADRSSFMTVWTPGQYLAPYLFERLGASLGTSMSLVTALFSLLGLLGWPLVFRALGFPLRSVAVATAAIAMSRYVEERFFTYWGGEVLLFGLAPWLTLVVWRLRDFPPVAVPVLLAAFGLVTFAKLAGAIYALALLGGAAFLAVRPRGQGSSRKLLLAGLIAVLFSWSLYSMWISRGGTILDQRPGLRAIAPASFYYPLAAVVTSPFGFDECLTTVLGRLSARGLLPETDPSLLSARLYAWLTPVAVAVLFAVWRDLRNGLEDYRRFLMATLSIYVVVLVLLYVSGADLTYRERFFRPAGTLLLIGVVHTLIRSPSVIIRSFLVGAVLASGAFSLASSVVHARYRLALPVSALGFRSEQSVAEVLDFVRAETAKDGSGGAGWAFFVDDSRLGLELSDAFRASRVFTQVDAANLDPRITGRAPRVCLALRRSFPRPIVASRILPLFTDYDQDTWRRVELGDFLLFLQ